MKFEGETPATTAVTPRPGIPVDELAAEAPEYSIRWLLRGASLYSLSNITLKTLGFFLVPVYTRVLTPTDYGIVGVAQAVIGIISPIIGLSLIGVLPILFYAYEGDERRRVISTIVNFMLLTGLVTTLALIFFSRPAFEAILSDVEFFPFIVLALITVYVTTMEFIPLNLFNMQDRPSAYAVYALALGGFGIALNLLFVVALGLGARGVLLAGVIAGSVGMIGAGFVVRRYWLPIMDLAKLRESLGLALPALPHAFAATLGRFADRLFLAGTTSLAVTGVYSLAVTFSTVALMILGGITTALNPLFYRRAHAGDESLKRDWARLNSLFLFAAVMVGLGLSLIGADLILILTPPDFHDAAEVLPLLVLGQLLFAMYWMLSPAIGFRRKMWAYPLASFPTVALTLVLNAILVPKLGGTGAAIALVSSAAAQLVLFGYVSHRYFPVPYEKRRIATLLIVGIVAFAVGSLVSEPVGLSLVTETVLIVAVPFVLLAVGFFTTSELAAARRVFARVVG